jgi:uncharacterized protein YqgC (DUF456 family)
MGLILLGVVLLAALLLIPLGLPGIWLIVGAVALYNPITGTEAVGTATIVGILVLATVAEVIEFTLAARYTKQYGGSRRAGWGAILGGIVGAIVGVPIPVVGSVIGAFVGSFVGALLAEWSRGTKTGTATRVATGALLGRVMATAAKVAIGMVMAVWTLVSAWQ